MLFRELDPGVHDAARLEDRKELVAILTAAIRGADAYAAVRRACKSEEGVVRIGNRFVRKSKLKEVGFLAVGQCAAAMARGFHDALGEIVTQGLVAGPEPPPDPWPFLYRELTEPTLPSKEGAVLAAEALELAEGLHEGDLFVPLLSPGALGMLASPPTGMGLEEYRELFAAVARCESAEEDLPLVAAALSPAQGGRLGAAAASAEIESLVVDRGDGGAMVGAGPVVAPPPDLRARARTVLEREHLWDGLPGAVQGDLTGGAPLARARTRSAHNVVVAAPGDALETAGAAAADRKHRPTLVRLHDPSPPEQAADHLLAALEAHAPKVAWKEGEGIALFSGLSLGAPEGGETSERIRRFLLHARSQLRRREATVAILSTAGSIREEAAPSGGFVDARTRFDAQSFRPKGPGVLDLPPGFTDVGALAVVYWTQHGAPSGAASKT